MSDHHAAIASFCDITGSQPHIAEHYLSASGWDLNRSVEFFLETPPDVAVAASGAALGNGVRAHPIDDELEGDEGRLASGQEAGAAGSDERDWHGAADEDDELRRALAASLNGGDVDPPRPAPQPHHQSMPPSLRGAAGGGRGGGGGGPRSHVLDDDDGGDAEDMGPVPSIYPTMFPGQDGGGFPRERQRSSGGPNSGPGRMFPAPGAAPSGSDRGGGDMSVDDVPEGVDPEELEEARMLEAAILGVPYRGARDFAAEAAELAALEADAAMDDDYEDYPGAGGVRSARRGAGAAVGASPATRETRSLRWEQDRDYEESLRADKAKTDAVARAKREEREAAQRAEREASEAAALKAAQEAEAAAMAGRRAADLARVREAKRQALPAEPVAGDGDGLTIMVRLPDGSRTSRRFRRSDPLQAIFDFLDIREEQQQPQQAGTSGADSASNDGRGQLLPGKYNLVTQFPRKVFVEGTGGSLADNGLTSDQALLVELIKT